MKKIYCSALFLILILNSLIVSAQSMTSADFQINDLTQTPTSGDATSADFRFRIYPSNVVITYDTPTATISGQPVGTDDDDNATITVSGALVVQYRYQLDGGGYFALTPVATLITLTSLSGGSHTLDVLGCDGLGNCQSTSTPTSATWTVATTENGFTSGSFTLAPSAAFDSALKNGLCITYKSYGLLTGTKQSGSTIYVNNLQRNVSYPTDTTWQSLRSFNYGDNLFNIFARKNSINSHSISISCSRRLVGDATGDGLVDDFDLALVARAWNTGLWNADFNEDGLVDDFDLSGLALNWGMQVSYE